MAVRPVADATSITHGSETAEHMDETSMGTGKFPPGPRVSSTASSIYWMTTTIWVAAHKKGRGDSMGKSLLVALAAISATLFAAGPASAATRPITFDMSLGYGAIYGSASDSAGVSLRWKDKAGQLKAQAQVAASDHGSWSYYAPDGVVVEPGDRLTASDGQSTRKLIVPNLTAVANRVKNVFKGTAPAGTKVFVECTFPGQPVPDIACQRVRLSVNDNGKWWYRPGWNVQGGDGAQLRWRSPEGDGIYFYAVAPYLVVTHGRAQVTGVARQSSTPAISLKDAPGGNAIGSWSGQVGLRQEFTGTFRDTGGNRVFVAPGQYLVSNIASDAKFVVPEIEASGDVETDTVSGSCEDTGRSAHEVWIQVYRAGQRRGFAITDTETDGSFSQDMTDFWFPDPSVIKHGDKLLIACLQKNRDFVQRWVSVP